MEDLTGLHINTEIISKLKEIKENERQIEQLRTKNNNLIAEIEKLAIEMPKTNLVLKYIKTDNDTILGNYIEK